MKMQIRLIKERETKGAVLYGLSKKPDNYDDEPVSNVYIRKAHLTAPYPSAIMITIEPTE